MKITPQHTGNITQFMAIKFPCQSHVYDPKALPFKAMMQRARQKMTVPCAWKSDAEMSWTSVKMWRVGSKNVLNTQMHTNVMLTYIKSRGYTFLNQLLCCPIYFASRVSYCNHYFYLCLQVKIIDSKPQIDLVINLERSSLTTQIWCFEILNYPCIRPKEDLW